MSKGTLLHILRNELEDAPNPLQTKDFNQMNISVAIENIESGDYTVIVSKHSCIIKSDDYDFYPNEEGAFYEEHEGSSRYYSALKAITSFLRWANKNNIII